ncbi:S26 family signal peptidase [Halovivax gelatinilyticus]|uniref:S26 family signal peptidase n=1 Tax=Halovivax gelatinilyticus TaxID=2961597 RepID=UPI0020CA4E70|nr:S26 family signal peptidase [Halovivax gelatinilyticus]
MTDPGSGSPRDDPDRRSPTESTTDPTVGDRPPTRPPESNTARSDDSPSIESDGILRWFITTDETAVVYTRDLVSSVGLVVLIALILFGISGVWPPLVAVESGSMEPNMHRGDMIFVVADDRFVGDGYVDGTGVVTEEAGAVTDHSTFGNDGDVIIFRPDGSATQTPVIHRASFWVEPGENWVDRGDPSLTNGLTCDEVVTCPAQHAGFITHGDANGGYDQLTANDGADTDVVKPEWIEGKAKYRIPWLGYVRLTVDETFSAGVVEATPGTESPADVGGLTVGLVATLLGAAAIARRS